MCGLLSKATIFVYITSCVFYNLMKYVMKEQVQNQNIKLQL